MREGFSAKAWGRKEGMGLEGVGEQFGKALCFFAAGAFNLPAAGYAFRYKIKVVLLRA